MSNTCGCNNESPSNQKINKSNKRKESWSKSWKNAVSDFKKAAPYLFIGIAMGSFIYGFVPTELIAKYTQKSNPFAVPVSAIIGVPLYVRAETVIPLSAALVSRGMSLGAAMALIIGSAGASLTEVILLKALFKNKLIAAFLVIILGMAIASGYILNAFV